MKKICLAVLLGMLCICACTFNEGPGDFPGPVKSDDNISGEADVPITNTTNDENGMQVAKNVENPQYLDVPLNAKAEEISYVDDTIFVPPFISDGKDAYSDNIGPRFPTTLDHGFRQHWTTVSGIIGPRFPMTLDHLCSP